MKKKKKQKITRYSILKIISAMMIMVIIFRLVYIQIYKNSHYEDKANTQSRRFITEVAPRGKIYDANGEVLATNKQTYSITYNEQSTSNNKSFFNVIQKVLKILDENGEKQEDNFELKIDDNNKAYFDFLTSDNSVKRAKELRFKKDRGFDDDIKKKLFSGSSSELTESQEEELNNELLKISPQTVFNKLLKDYKFYELLTSDENELKKYKDKDPNDIAEELSKKYSFKDLRRIMIIKDTMKMQSFSGFKSINIASDIKKETAFIISEKLTDLPGINVVNEPMRDYPHNELASNVIGYVSSIDASKKNRYEEKGYDLSTDLIGVSGIEGAFENVLRGSNGGTTIKVDSSGKKIEELFKLETAPGNNVHLTIDKNIQYSAETMLKHQLEYLQNGYKESGINTSNATRGAAVAVEVKTGRILAMVSYPGFDPNLFASRSVDSEVSKKYFNPDLEKIGEEYIKARGLNITVDELFPKNSNGVREDIYDVLTKPLYNYATLGLIPPGSTFKPMTSVAALEEGVVTDSEEMVDHYYFNTHPETFGTAFAPKDNSNHGVVNIRKALAVSCNYFYYESAYRMYMKNGADTKALDSIAKYAWKAGLGVDPNSNAKKGTGIEIAENFGTTYSFEEFREQNVLYSKFDIVDFLGKGNYNNTYYFAPLDIAYNETDSEELKKIKSEIKSLISNKIAKIGDENITDGLDELKRKFISLLGDLEKNSEKYRKNIEEYNKKNNVKDSKNMAANAVEAYLYSKNTSVKTPAEIINASIGQGINNFTPLQLAVYISTIVNGGTRYKAYLVDKVTDYEGNVIDEYKPEVLDRLNLKESTVNVIKDGMEMANTADMGTASSVFRNFPISSGGKTGTATFRDDQKKYGREAFGVYVSFAPKEDPEVAVAVVIYDGAHGYLGSPVARAIYETYFRDKIKSEYGGYTPVYMDTQQPYDFTLNPPLETKEEIETKEEKNE